MSVINTNITSMIGQQNLSKSQSALQTSMERLSSGLRINSAKDDAAGQAIANRMTAQITGLAQAQRNANDGISVSQTAEGALNQVNDNLQRIRELTVQSQNGTNSQDDLNSIQDEINQRLSEIDRISEETNFNGVKVLASDQALQIQVGANDSEQISVNLKEITASTLGMEGFSVSGNSLNVSEAITQTNLSGTPTDVNLNAVATKLGLSDASNLSLHNIQDSSGNATANYVVKSGDDFYAASVNDTSGVVTLNGTDVTYEDGENGVGATTLEDVVAKVGVADDGTVTAYVEIQGKNYAADAGVLANSGDDTGTQDVATGTIYLSETGTNAPTAQFDGASSANPLAKLDEALKNVDNLRSELGAVQNRFESAITNLSTNETNLSAARSRIEDADYAVEVANMTRAQILQQAGTSVLAQANQIPQNVLSLLG